MIDGIKFDSKSEGAYYCYLKMMGVEIVDMQAKVYLTRARILYKPDFVIVDKDTSEVVWVDVKGFSTPVSNIKMRLWAKYGPGSLRIVQVKGKSFSIVKEIERTH